MPLCPRARSGVLLLRCCWLAVLLLCRLAVLRRCSRAAHVPTSPQRCSGENGSEVLLRVRSGAEVSSIHSAAAPVAT
jgi:hypothetical protein